MYISNYLICKRYMRKIESKGAQVSVDFDQLEYILLCAITLKILALLYCMMLFSGTFATLYVMRDYCIMCEKQVEPDRGTSTF